jgi:hypothetical protein
MRIASVDVSEVGRDVGQFPPDLFVGEVPVPQSHDREAVPHDMQTQSATVGWAAQTDLPG